MNNYDTAPRDGTVFLIEDYDSGRVYGTAVYYREWTDDERQEMGVDDHGIFLFADSVLADMYPDGPEIPFNWKPCPFNSEEAGDGRQ